MQRLTKMAIINQVADSVTALPAVPAFGYELRSQPNAGAAGVTRHFAVS